MRVSGSTPPLPPAVHHARSSGRPDASGPAEAALALAPVSILETPEPDAPVESGKAHGLVRAAEHSHRSDVAALRQWINHPDLRSDLSLPDLSTEHKGNGFQKAVAAYEAVIGLGNPTPSTEPAPVPEPDPVVSDPAPVVSDPAPVVSDPAPIPPDSGPVGDPVVTSDVIPSSEGAPVLDVAPIVDPTTVLEALLPQIGSGEDA